MIGRNGWLVKFGAHFWYDFGTLALTFWVSRVIWKQEGGRGVFSGGRGSAKGTSDKHSSDCVYVRVILFVFFFESRRKSFEQFFRQSVLV